MDATTSTDHRNSPIYVERLESRRMLSAAAATIVPGELLVNFKPGVSRANIAEFYGQNGLSEREALDRYAKPNASHLKLVSVPAARTMQLINVLQRDPRVAYVEPNYITSNATTAATPTELNYAAEWNLNNTGQWSSTPDADVDAPEAWNVTTGNPEVLVAVLDSGVDYNHPDLAANIWTNPFEVAGDGIDNDHNGYVDDVHGINAVNDSGDPLADDANGVLPGHGTGVAGIIGALPFNEGTVGVAWRVGMVCIKVISAANTMKTSDVVQAFQYVNYLKNVQGQNILLTNNSWHDGDLGKSEAAKDAMAGLDQPGMSPILHVCAAANENTNIDLTPDFPAGFDLDNIISVAATDTNDLYADFSNYGATSVDLAAPGAGIGTLTTAPNNRYSYTFSGTSAASPHVAGAAALIWSAFPTLSAAQVKQRILSSVDPIGHIGNNSDKPTLTNGRLSIFKALAGAPTNSDRKAPAAVVNLSGGATTFQSATINWTATGDDGALGRGALYDIRYSTAPITSSNWDAATRVLGELGPKSAGAPESFTVTGLEPAKAYYFAMKVRDDTGNESSVSNSAPATTSAAVTLYNDNGEHGANGWSASGLWHQSAARANSPATSWYYGIEASHTYNTGTPNSGELTSPIIDLRKNAAGSFLIYREWRQVEDIEFADRAKVQVSTNGSKWDTLYQSEFSTSVDAVNFVARAASFGYTGTVKSKHGTPQWATRAVDLSAYAGQTVRVRFSFDTIDDFGNNFEGWYVDDVNVFAAAATMAAAPAAARFSGVGIGSATSPEDTWEQLDAVTSNEVLPGLV